MKAVPLEMRRIALLLEDGGLRRDDVCIALGVSRSSVARWRTRAEPLLPQPGPCWGCVGTTPLPPDPWAYLYVLGQYLGDGHVAPVGRGRGPARVLRVYGDDAWPGIQDEVSVAMKRVLPVGVFRSTKRGCHAIEAISAHWTCVLPQHGPGKKHTRPIGLLDWQRRLVRDDPRPLLRGLIHSDGCRTTNRVVTRGTAYSYPRYFFSNVSQDILDIFTGCLDQLLVPWRYSRPTVVSVARRDGVARLDSFVGPKF